MPSKQWFKLDTAGKMYSSIKSSRATTLFRLSADLKKNVDPDILQLSLDHIIERFPYFNVNLRRGYFGTISIRMKVTHALRRKPTILVCI